MIKLTKIEEADLEILMHWRMLPEIRKYMYTEPQLTMDLQYEWFNSINMDPTCKHWMIEFEGTKIGTLNLAKIDVQNGRCSWGYYIANTSFRGRGIGRALEYNIYDFVFCELKLNKLVSEIFAFNEKVIELHKKCGSQVEGNLREHIKKGGTYYDVVVMGILRDEWLDLKNKLDYDKVHIEGGVG